jgi:hypothetical protein
MTKTVCSVRPSGVDVKIDNGQSCQPFSVFGRAWSSRCLSIVKIQGWARRL